MKPSVPRSSSRNALVFILLAGSGLVVALILASRYSAPQPAHSPEIQAVTVVTNALSTSTAINAVKTNVAQPSTIAAGVPPNYPDFQERPFPTAYESSNIQWTLADGKDTNVIRQLAHNDLEYQRMVDENDRIKRRQLVYEKVTVPMLIERIRGTGQRLESITLPGLDGREIEMEVREIHDNSAMQFGSVSGRVKGSFNSMATVGFSHGYESFNIYSPDDQLYLVADAREPGQLMIKEIDPNQYAPAKSGEPDYILTGQSAPSPKSNPISIK